MAYEEAIFSQQSEGNGIYCGAMFQFLSGGFAVCLGYTIVWQLANPLKFHHRYESGPIVSANCQSQYHWIQWGNISVNSDGRYGNIGGYTISILVCVYIDIGSLIMKT